LHCKALAMSRGTPPRGLATPEPGRCSSRFRESASEGFAGSESFKLESTAEDSAAIVARRRRVRHTDGGVAVGGAQRQAPVRRCPAGSRPGRAAAERGLSGMDAASLVIDDPRRGVFRVNRTALRSPALLELEWERVFDQVWLYVGHESEIEQPGDYRRRTIARRPVLL